MPEYSLALLIVFICTLLLHRFSGVKIYQSFRHFLIFNGVSLLLATLWDQFAIYRGHWSFDSRFLLGPKIGFMPIEEFLFVLVVSYFVLVFFKITEKQMVIK